MKITPESTITVTCKCAECKGTGVVSNPIWDEFNREVKAGKASNEKMDEWFCGRGYGTTRLILGKTTGVLPPEEITCGECEGTRFTHASVTLQEIAAFLKTGGQGDTRPNHVHIAANK